MIAWKNRQDAGAKTPRVLNRAFSDNPRSRIRAEEGRPPLLRHGLVSRIREKKDTGVPLPEKHPYTAYFAILCRTGGKRGGMQGPMLS
jgi:hypothetical protein